MQTKKPVKFLNENEASLYSEVSDVKAFYRRTYFDAVDTVNNCIKKTIFTARIQSC